MQDTGPKKIMVIAAEASGDALGAGLIQALEHLSPNRFSFLGLGGTKMAQVGIKSLFDISELSIIGFVEAIKAAGKIKKRIKEVVDWALQENPDVVVLIDSWGFTIRVAIALRKANPAIRLIKYVAPQVWAMRPKRAKQLADKVDLLLALHPMDVPYFTQHGLKTITVGNPAVHVDLSKSDPVAFRKQFEIHKDSKLLLLLPGSRPSEIARLMPVFAQTAALLRKKFLNLHILLPVAPSVQAQVRQAVASLGLDVCLIDSEKDKYVAMMAADTALACSGTVSTELALCGNPMVIAYRVEPITYWIFENFSTIDHVTMINIMAKEEIIPEFIQKRCTPENLSAALAQRLENKALCQEQVLRQNAVLELMGRHGRNTHLLAAEAVLEFCEA